MFLVVYLNIHHLPFHPTRHTHIFIPKFHILILLLLDGFYFKQLVSAVFLSFFHARAGHGVYCLWTWRTTWQVIEYMDHTSWLHDALEFNVVEHHWPQVSCQLLVGWNLPLSHFPLLWKAGACYNHCILSHLEYLFVVFILEGNLDWTQYFLPHYFPSEFDRSCFQCLLSGMLLWRRLRPVCFCS